MNETLAERLGQFAFEVGAEGLPDHLASDVINRLVDLMGVALAAAGDATVIAVADTVGAWGGSGTASVLESGVRLPAPSAALINGTMAHALDFDDTHLPSIVHPSSSVIPAALAAAEDTGGSGERLMAAIAIGLETTVRLGMASYDAELGNHVFFERGLHATSILGALGAAVAASSLYGLGASETTSAIGIASSMGAGLLEANRTGGTVKRLHNGWAAHSGIAAAQLARAGITGPPTVLEGRFGLFQAYSSDRWSAAPVIEGLGRRWEFTNVHYKPYPTNHFTHAGIDAALAAKVEGIDIAAINRIELGVPAPTLRTIAEPAEEKRSPANGYSAKFSGPYTVAAALAGGGGLGVGHADFTDAMAADPVRRRLAGLVTCVADDVSTRRFPNAFGGVLRLWLDHQEPIEIRVDDSRGGPVSPLSDAELDQKFLDNAARADGGPSPGRMLEMIRGIRSAGSVGDVMAGLSSKRDAGSE